jgi:hypothetical protein
MSTIYLSAAIADWAAQQQRAHDVAEGGWWCKACHRRGRGKIAAGTCETYTRAQGFIDYYRSQKAPPARPVAGRVWSRD